METVQRACDTVRGRRRGPAPLPRLPLAPLLRLYRGPGEIDYGGGRRNSEPAPRSHAAFGIIVGASRDVVRQAIYKGVSIWRTDAWAVALGYHPCEVWGPKWAQLTGGEVDEDDLSDIDLSRVEVSRAASMARHPSTWGRGSVAVADLGGGDEAPRVVARLEITDEVCDAAISTATGWGGPLRRKGLPDAA